MKKNKRERGIAVRHVSWLETKRNFQDIWSKGKKKQTKKAGDESRYRYLKSKGLKKNCARQPRKGKKNKDGDEARAWQRNDLRVEPGNS